MVKQTRHILWEEDNLRALGEVVKKGINIQLVYMDPPYNTGRQRGARRDYGDTDRTGWEKTMTSIGNLAYEALNNSGFLAISINQMELFNIQPIMKKVFGEGCFIGIFPIKIRHKDRQLMINATFHDVFEYLLIYRKNKKSRFYTEKKSAREDKFIYEIQIKSSPSEIRIINGKKVEIFHPGQYEIIQTGYSPSALRRYVIAGKLATANWSGEWFESHLRPLGDDTLIKVHGLENAGLGYRWFQTGNKKRNSGVYFQSQLNAGRPILPTNDLDYTEIVPTIYREGGSGCDFKDSKKPEALLQFLLQICTKPGDVVLDPYGGSGTTLAVAIKMNRFSITIENSPTSIATIKRRINNLKEGLDLDKLRHSFIMEKSLEKLLPPENCTEIEWAKPKNIGD